MTIRPYAAALLLVLASGCRHELNLYFGVAEPDAGDSGQTNTDSDARVAEREDAGGHAGGQDAGVDPFPYRWVEPTVSREEGAVVIPLDCERSGEPANCPMLCTLDGFGLGTCGDQESVFVKPGAHEFCVTVHPTPGDEEFAGQTREQCVQWTAEEIANPHHWVVVQPSADSTELSLPLQCRRDPPLSADEPARDDCTFRCSLDNEPYEFCFGAFERSGLLPGSHELRVETAPPNGDPYQRLRHVRLLSFTIASTAQPPVVRPVVELPPPVPEDQLGELAPLLDAYVVFARRCSGLDLDSEYREAMHSYLSYGVSTGSAAAEEDIDACLDDLSAIPAPCRYPWGVAEYQTREFMLPVRLPFKCENLLTGVGEAGARCVTHADCLDICERKSDFFSESDGFGACGFGGYDGLAEEGIMCKTRGCGLGLYCAGTCKPVKQLGEVCTPILGGVDCRLGYTCKKSPPQVCIRSTGKPGDECSVNRDCISARCDYLAQRCQ
jgi:hypothetical protein